MSGQISIVNLNIVEASTVVNVVELNRIVPT
jgi:hypothetical protein